VAAIRANVFRAAAAAAALALLFVPGLAKIERLTLAQMVRRADNCVAGRIVARQVFRVDHPRDGDELYFTRLSIEGRSLCTGRSIEVAVTFAGGVMPDGDGVWNSEAPAADDTKVGNDVVVFYKWSDNLGGDVAGNALYCAHGGLFRIAHTRKGDFVLGRGEGYAIDGNALLGELEKQIVALR
jgi:hypothetical protein